MEDNKDPKWYITDAIHSGKLSLHLLDLYGTDLQPRLKSDEAPQHKANVEELETRVPGQKQTLIAQKSDTQAQEKAIDKLNEGIVKIRNVVRNNNASKEISIAYGVGNRIIKTVSSVTAAGNVLADAYAKYTAWSKDAGILESDITDIKTLIKAVGEKETTQDNSVYERKAKTMDKNTLQRTVEDEVSRLSAIGMLHFAKNAVVCKQFEELIPASHNPKNGADKNKKTEGNSDSAK